MFQNQKEINQLLKIDQMERKKLLVEIKVFFLMKFIRNIMLLLIKQEMKLKQQNKLG